MELQTGQAFVTMAASIMPLVPCVPAMVRSAPRAAPVLLQRLAEVLVWRHVLALGAVEQPRVVLVVLPVDDAPVLAEGRGPDL